MNRFQSLMVGVLGVLALPLAVHHSVAAGPATQPTTRPAVPAAEGPPAEPAAVPKIEVVFVLDTTGSMNGLIQAAKEKVWAIANALATSKPTPAIRMGLVAYRDRGDDYITRATPLTDDLDAVYKDLMGFSAGGGGDTPESVNQALAEAVSEMSWSRDRNTYRVIFLVGDCPPHMDYSDDVKYPDTCRRAAAAGITINTIQCGTASATEAPWRDIARLAEGAYFRVEQSGGVILANTPYDARLAELATELDGTRLPYGSREMVQAGEDRAAVARAISAAAPTAAQAERATFNTSAGGKTNAFGRNDLVEDVSAGRVKLEALKKDELPAALQAMDAAGQQQFVAERAAHRAKISAEVAELARQREAHLAAQRKQAAGSQPSFDAVVLQSVQQQAQKAGIAYDTPTGK